MYNVCLEEQSSENVPACSVMNDLFGVYLGHGCHITHQFIQAQALKKNGND